MNIERKKNPLENALDLLSEMSNEDYAKWNAERFDPANGHVTQQYLDWLHSPEAEMLHKQRIYLNVNHHTTATPAEILAEFNRVWANLQEEIANGTAEEMNWDD